MATYINRLREALGEDPGIHFAYGPAGLPRRNRLTRLLNLGLDLVWLHVALPLIARRRRAQVIHAPVNWLPWWSPCRTVVTVQDLAWERVPESYPGFFRRYASVFARRSARRASVVIATSRSTADDLRELYGLAEGRARIVPIGVDADREPAERRRPFVLHVGEFEPRKRVLELIEGHRRYFRAAGEEPEPCRLVLAGAGGALEAQVRAAAGPECDVLGFVTEPELIALYREATLLVMPSRYEGFGLPVAEALGRGCPVMVADNSSLREVAGPSALVLADADPAGLASALADALADRDALRDRGERGRVDVADRLSWDRAARLTADAYREALR